MVWVHPDVFLLWLRRIGSRETRKGLIQVVMHGLEGSIEVNGESYNGQMPQHSFLSDEQIAQVLTYIRQNFGNNRRSHFRKMKSVP